MGARRSSGDRGRAGADPVRSVIGRWIRENREFQHVTQAELCRSLRERGVQVSPSTLSRWERGEASPGADVLALLGVELGSSLAALEERIHAAMVRSREEVDVTGREPRELVERADRAARAGNYHRALALLEAADDLVRLSGDEAPGELHAGLLLRLAAAHMKLWHLEMARQALVRYGTLPGDSRQRRFRGLVYRLNLARKERDWSGGDLLVRRLEALLSASEPREQAEAHQVLGGFWRARRKLDLAVEHFGAALAKRRETGPKAEETRALLFLGYCLAAAGKDRVGGERMVLEALSTSRRQGFRDIETWALYYLGRCRIESGNLEEGLAALEEAAERARDLRLDEARFAALYRAWLAVGGDDLLGRLRRLLAGIHPMVEEARQLRARLAGDGGYREVEP